MLNNKRKSVNHEIMLENNRSVRVIPRRHDILAKKGYRFKKLRFWLSKFDSERQRRTGLNQIND